MRRSRPLCSRHVRRLARLAVAIAVLVSGGCAEDVLEVELRLVESSCSPADLASVKMLSVDVLGFRNSDEPCNLRKRCVDVLEVPTRVEDLTEILRDPDLQPLIDTPFEGADSISVVARTEAGSCFKAERYPVCGISQLENIDDDGVLEINMRCDSCDPDAFAVPQCP